MSNSKGDGLRLTVDVVSLSSGTWPISAREAWEQLFAIRSDYGPYHTPCWVSCWISQFAREVCASQLVVRTPEGTPVGTCIIGRKDIGRRFVSLRRGFLNTDGEAEHDSVVVEHNALLLHRDFEPAVCRLIRLYIEDAGLDEFRVRGADVGLVAPLAAEMQGWRRDIEPHRSPYIDLSVQPYFERLGRNTRQQLERTRKFYEQAGPVVVECPVAPVMALDAFDEMVSLHNAYWRGKGQDGAFATARRLAFHRSLVSVAAPAGEIELVRVRSGNGIVGILYNLTANGRVAYYQSGISYPDDVRIKPGLFLHRLAVDAYARRGFLEYDFLPSPLGEGHYKERLATQHHELVTITFQRPGVRRTAFQLARLMRHFFRANRTNA